MPHVEFGQARPVARELPHVTDRVVMVDGLHVIFERLAANRDALLNGQRGFGGAERVPLNRVLRVGQFQIEDTIQVLLPAWGQDAEAVKLGLLDGDLLDGVFHNPGRAHVTYYAPGKLFVFRC